MNSKMNIAFLMSSLSFGGAERVAVSYANWLAENTEHNVYIIKFDQNESAYPVNEKVTIINQDYKSANSRIKAIKERFMFCKKSFERIKPDIIFAMFYQTQLYAYYSKPKYSKLIGSERCNIKKRKYLAQIMSKKSSKQCDGYIFQSNGIKLLFPQDVQEKSIVIPNAISNDKIYSINNVKKQRIITAMGRLTEQKGFDCLIKAFGKVSKSHPEYQLIIYGEGCERENLTKLISDLDLEGKVLLPGSCADAIQKVACSDIFVLSSRFEGMPNALIEAMASGVACISTDCEFGPSDLIVNNSNGILIKVDDEGELANQINYLIEHDDVRLSLSQNALKIRDRLDKRIIYREYYDYFQAIYHQKNIKNKNIFRKVIERIELTLIHHNCLRFLSDQRYLKMIYHLKMNRKLNLKNPETFNEKLQWLKVYDHNPNYVKMVDKYQVREYIKEQIGEEYLIPLLGSYNTFDEIDFAKLPKKFVIKCNHDSGGLVVCSDKEKLDIKKAKEKIEKSLKRNYYYLGREWPYKNVSPKIIIEKYMTDQKNGQGLIDYKVMCFNGIPKLLFTCTERFSKNGLKVTFFNTEWERLPFERHYPKSENKIDKPQNFDLMLDLSKKLAKDIPFVRVDWYEINGKLYFGELTFYPGSGCEEFNPDIWDYKVGSLLELPPKRR